MSTTADLTGADVGAAGGRAGRILGAVPVWMVLAVAFFLIVGIAGIVLMTVPDLSKLVYRQSLSKAFAPPFTKGTLLGADQLGRAIEYRLLAGLGISLVSAAVVTMMATVIGLAMGLFAGLFGRTADRLVTIIIVPIAFNFLPETPMRDWLLGSLPWMAVFFIVMVVIGIIYRYGPNVKAPRTPIFTWGALFAALAWAVVSYGFSSYLSSFNSYNRIYGSIGAVVALLMWFFLGGFSVLLGALINLELARRRRFIAARALRQGARESTGK